MIEWDDLYLEMALEILEKKKEQLTEAVVSNDVKLLQILMETK